MVRVQRHAGCRQIDTKRRKNSPEIRIISGVSGELLSKGNPDYPHLGQNYYPHSFQKVNRFLLIAAL